MNIELIFNDYCNSLKSFNASWGRNNRVETWKIVILVVMLLLVIVCTIFMFSGMTELGYISFGLLSVLMIGIAIIENLPKEKKRISLSRHRFVKGRFLELKKVLASYSIDNVDSIDELIEILEKNKTCYDRVSVVRDSLYSIAKAVGAVLSGVIALLPIKAVIEKYLTTSSENNTEEVSQDVFSETMKQLFKNAYQVICENGKDLLVLLVITLVLIFAAVWLWKSLLSKLVQHKFLMYESMINDLKEYRLLYSYYEGITSISE